MAEKQEFWTERRLKQGIIALVVGIAIVAAGIFGWYYWLNKPEGGSVPPVIQRQIDEAKAAIKKNKNDIGSRIALAQYYIQIKNYDDAIAECQLILKTNKENEYAVSLIGVSYDLKGDQKNALKYYQKTILLGEKKKMSQLNPAIVEARFRSGKIYLSQKNYDMALVQFQALSDQNATDADSRYYLGLTFYQMGKNDKAIEWLEKATRFVPDYFDAFYTLGQAYEKQGDKAKAIAAYKQAIKSKPDFQEAKDALAKLEK